MSADGHPSRLTLGTGITVAILSISTAAILIRLSEAPSLVIALYRLTIATSLLGAAALAWPQARREIASLEVREWIGLSAVGIVLAIHFAAWIESLSLTTVASSVVLVTLHPVFVGLASHRLFGEGLGRLGWIGVTIALLGGGVIAYGDSLQGNESLLGDLLALIGAVAAAIYFLAGRDFRRRLSLLAYVVPVYLVASLALLAMVLANQDPLTGYPPREWILFTAMAVVPMILGHTVLNYALKYVTAPVIATTVLGEPVGSTILAILILGELPPWLTVVGGAVVLTGIAMVVHQEEAAEEEARAEVGA